MMITEVIIYIYLYFVIKGNENIPNVDKLIIFN